MTDAPSIGIALAFMAGLLSFLSPCVLPLIPSYITFISGVSLDDVSQSRRTAFVHSLLFVLGFTLIFLALGAGATVLGSVLRVRRDWIARVGGVEVVRVGSGDSGRAVATASYVAGALALLHRRRRSLDVLHALEALYSPLERVHELLGALERGSWRRRDAGRARLPRDSVGAARRGARTRAVTGPARARGRG